MEITPIALLVMVGRTTSLMPRIIKHDAIVRKSKLDRDLAISGQQLGPRHLSGVTNAERTRFLASPE